MAADLGISLFASTGILLVLAFITTVLRCIARIYVVKAFALDDWLMVLSLAIFVHYSGWVFYGRNIDRGRPDDQIPLSDVIPALRSFYFAELSYFLVTCSIKMSIGTFLLRIVKTRTQKWTIHIALFIVFLYSTIAFFVAVFQCKPVSRFWHPEGPGKCLGNDVIIGIGYTHSTIIATSDFFFAVLPMFVVWSLQMNRNMKISVTVLMGFGAIAGVSTIARVPYISAIVAQNDFFHNTTRLAILSSVEPGLGIILCSAAATRPLFRTAISKTRAWSTFHSIRSNNISPGTGASASKRHDIRSAPHNKSGEDFIRLNSMEGNGKGFNSVVETERLKRDCSKCGDILERNSSCHKCGDTVSSEARQQGAPIPPIKDSIYNHGSVKRAVEFVKK